MTSIVVTMEKLIDIFRHRNVFEPGVDKEDRRQESLVTRIDGLLIGSASVTLSLRLQSKSFVLDSSSSLALKLRDKLITSSFFLDQRCSISEIT